MRRTCRLAWRRVAQAWVIAGVLASPAIALADSLSGRVQDAQGLAIPNARVKLLDRSSGEQRNTVSDREGTYRFDGLASGTYVIEAEAATATLVAAQEVSVSGERTLDVTLKVAGARSEVLVTASSRPQTATEVGKAIDVVDAEQMSLRGVFQISEALRVLPGVQVQTLEGPGSFTTIQIRGLRNADTAVLVDGMRFQDSGSPQNDATSFLEDFTTTDTERVELLRGSSSSLYGSSAMAGVINIVSRSGGGPLRAELRGEGGGLGLVRGVAGVSGGAGRDRLNYSGSLSYVNVTDGVRERSPYRNTSGQGSLRLAIRPQVSLTGRLWANTAKLTSTESPTFSPAVLANLPASGRLRAVPLPDDQLALFEQRQPITAGSATYIPNAIDPDGNRLSSFVSGMGVLQHAVSNDTAYRVAYQGVDTRRGYRDGPLGSGSFEPLAAGTSHFNGRTDTVQARLDQRAGRLNFITGGYEFVRETYFAYNDTPISDARTNVIELAQRSHSVYAQDQISLLGSRLQVALSGRAQFFELQQPEFSGAPNNPYEGSVDTIETPNAYTGDVSVAYFFQGSGTKLRVHGGNSFRAPASYERFGGGSGSYYGDPRLKPERSVSVDGGVDQWLFDSKLQVSGTVFWTELQEFIRFGALPAPDPFGRVFGGYQNGGGGRARGVELGASLSPGRSTRAQVSYTYANSESETATFGTDYFRILGLAPHTFAFSITQWVRPQVHATFDLYTKSSYDLTLSGAAGRLFEFDGPTKANLVVGYRIPAGGGGRHSVEIYGKVENLFDDVPYEDGFIGPGRWATAGVRLSY